MIHELNLIPAEVVEKELRARSFLRRGGILLLALLLTSAAYGTFRWWTQSLGREVSHLHQERTLAQARLQAMSEQMALLRAERGRLLQIEQTLQGFTEKQPNGLILTELRKSIPLRVQLTRLEVNPPDRINLHGRAFSNEDLADFLERLGHSAPFTGMGLRYVRWEKEGEKSFVVFEIQQNGQNTLPK